MSERSFVELASGGADNRVVQYFYVHSAGESYSYPTGRGRTDPRRLTALYLECALVQAASLTLRDAACEQLLVWNLRDPHDKDVLGDYGVRLVREIEALGVQIRFAEYEHRFSAPAPEYMASRYILDAMKSASSTARPGQALWFTDLDVFWWAPERIFASAPSDAEVACLYIDYTPDWNVMLGTTPTTVGEFGTTFGPCAVPVPWVGGEILGATAAGCRDFVAACEQLERDVGQAPEQLPAEEHLFSLAGGLGRVRYKDLSAQCHRMFTGARHSGDTVADPTTYGFWHLPGEKGLSFRRTAVALLKGRHERLAREFADPAAASRRFNLAPPRLTRRFRDDGWLASDKLLRAASARLARIPRS